MIAVSTLCCTASVLCAGGRSAGSTRAAHQAEKAAAASAAELQQARLQRAALLRSNAPRLAVWDSNSADSAAASSVAAADAASAPLPAFSPRFDHICLAASDVSHLSDFLTQAGGRACEGFLTPVYLSSTSEPHHPRHSAVQYCEHCVFCPPLSHQDVRLLCLRDVLCV